MRFHNTYPPEINGYAQPEPNGYYGGPQAYGYYPQPEQYGYFAQEDPAYANVDPAYGYYAQVDPNYGYYADVDPAYGYYAEADPTYGYYGEVDPTYGYYAQEPEPQGRWEGYGYGQYEPARYPEPGPVGYYAEEVPVGPYNQAPMGYYGEAPEPAGYSEPQPQYESPAVGYYGEPEYSGYAREVSPPFNAGCPLPTNVNGLDDGFAGYARPATVNASCSQFTEQPGSPAVAPDTFKPLW